MRKVIGIGETVLDIIFRNHKPVEAVPGGSTFNGIVSLGRAGVNTKFLSEVGNDRIGEYVTAFLKENGVSTDYINVYPGVKSPVSLAFLDEHNNADYIFYKDSPRDRLDFSFPKIEPDDIVVFGSFYAVDTAVRPQLAGLLDNAREHGAIVYYDVNFRRAHSSDVMRVTPNLLDNLDYADIVRGSREDFEVLYKMDNPDKVYSSEISFYSKRFIYTDGPKPVVLFADGGLREEYPVAPADTVSTIGAGDNFNAGFVYGLMKYGITRKDIVNGLDGEQWGKLVECAQMFSADCCRGIFNYVSPEFGMRMKEELKNNNETNDRD